MKAKKGYEKGSEGKGCSKKSSKKTQTWQSVAPENDVTSFQVSNNATYVVRFLNPTSNKALHLGHFRNAALGTAIAGSLRAMGARTIQHCMLEDVGMFMFRAVAGFRDIGQYDLSSLETAKSDHVVGYCYKEFSRRLKAAKKPGGKNIKVDPRAPQKLQRKWLAGDPQVHSMWHQVRSLAIKGQQQTLKRLGIAFDYSDHESSEDLFLPEFLDRGIAAGQFKRKSGGQVYYPSKHGREIGLIGGNRLPFENLRLLSFLYRAYRVWPEQWLNLVVAGSEWCHSMAEYTDILERLGICRSREIYHPVFTGMVTIDGRKMASSDGHGILIDHLLDRLILSPRIHAIAQTSRGRLKVDQVSALVARIFLLKTPRRKVLSFSMNAFMDDDQNPGWKIARAWAGMHPHENEPSLANPNIRQEIERSLQSVSFENIVKFLHRYCIAWLESPESINHRETIANTTLLLRCLGVSKSLEKTDPFPPHSILGAWEEEKT